MVQPEGHPGHADDHECGDIDGDNVIRELSLELHVHAQTGIGSCGCFNVTLEQRKMCSSESLLSNKLSYFAVSISR